jgi:uncharacterized protein (TIGR03118 family)
MRLRSILALLFCTLVGATARADHFRADHFTVRNLVSNDLMHVPAEHEDPNLVNAWGLAASNTSPWWVADNGSNVSTLYDGEGIARSLVVMVQDAPTGEVFNGTGAFPVTDPTKTMTATSLFIWAAESGTIFGWNPNVGPGNQAFLLIDSSAGDAVYKGLALAEKTCDGPRLYATDFHNNKVDVFDGNNQPVHLHKHAFTDPWLPSNYAPFGIAVHEGHVFVTYAEQDDARHDDVKGPGHGFIDEYDLDGRLLERVASRGVLNSPWGLEWAPKHFGRFSEDLLVGNFGDGKIHAFEEDCWWGGYELAGALLDGDHKPIVIDGLWSIKFGNDGGAGPSTTLFFTAGPNGENDGLFGRLDRVRHDDP